MINFVHKIYFNLYLLNFIHTRYKRFTNLLYCIVFICLNKFIKINFGKSALIKEFYLFKILETIIGFGSKHDITVQYNIILKMMYRSESMELLAIIIPKDIAWDILTDLS